MTELFDQTLPRRDFLKMSGALAAGTTLAITGLAQAESTATPKGHPPVKTHTDLKGGMALMSQEVVDTLTSKDYSHLIGKVQGLSEKQLRNHFKLYEGYVNKANQLHQLIANADADMLASTNPTYAPYREMNVELSYAHNGVVLHELYFGNLGYQGDPSQSLQAMITRDFGSWDNYLKHLVAVGKSMRGWAMTALDLRDGHIRNFGLDLHNQGSPMHVYPLLVLDVYEHAYMIDYATDRAKYLEVFLQNTNWQAVNDRLLFGVHHLMTGPKSTD